MSQENVEIVRRGYEAFNRGDIDGVVGLLAPAFEYVASARGACCHSSPKALVRHPGLSTHGARRKTRVGPDVDWGWPRIGAAWAGVVSAPRSNYSNTQKGAPCFGLERVKQSHSQGRGG
jgi:hypothetical protein